MAAGRANMPAVQWFVKLKIKSALRMSLVEWTVLRFGSEAGYVGPFYFLKQSTLSIASHLLLYCFTAGFIPAIVRFC
jgi:hypothetical protein